ncbi:MAG: hypothetical protein IPL61_24285 [Myxococcales bacterium]|nr:hypothetical protein [Myxococcales bacterium]
MEFSVGTTIVIIHSALANREQRRKQQWQPVEANDRAPRADARPASR